MPLRGKRQFSAIQIVFGGIEGFPDLFHVFAFACLAVAQASRVHARRVVQIIEALEAHLARSCLRPAGSAQQRSFRRFTDIQGRRGVVRFELFRDQTAGLQKTFHPGAREQADRVLILRIHRFFKTLFIQGQRHGRAVLQIFRGVFVAASVRKRRREQTDGIRSDHVLQILQDIACHFVLYILEHIAAEYDIERLVRKFADVLFQIHAQRRRVFQPLVQNEFHSLVAAFRIRFQPGNARKESGELRHKTAGSAGKIQDGPVLQPFFAVSVLQILQRVFHFVGMLIVVHIRPLFLFRQVSSLPDGILHGTRSPDRCGRACPDRWTRAGGRCRR